MRQTVIIEKLADQEVGSVALVITKRIFRKAIEDRYVCYRKSLLTGARWANKETGYPPPESLELKLNSAAMAAALAELING